jgi:flavorubredoxin
MNRWSFTRAGGNGSRSCPEAISKVIPLDRIRHIGYSHFEGDEAGAMNEFLAVAPHAVPFASHVSVMTSLHDQADRPGRGLADGQMFSTGKKTW